MEFTEEIEWQGRHLSWNNLYKIEESILMSVHVQGWMTKLTWQVWYKHSSSQKIAKVENYRLSSIWLTSQMWNRAPHREEKILIATIFIQCTHMVKVPSYWLWQCKSYKRGFSKCQKHGVHFIEKIVIVWSWTNNNLKNEGNRIDNWYLKKKK